MNARSQSCGHFDKLGKEDDQLTAPSPDSNEPTPSPTDAPTTKPTIPRPTRPTIPTVPTRPPIPVPFRIPLIQPITNTGKGFSPADSWQPPLPRHPLDQPMDNHHDDRGLATDIVSIRLLHDSSPDLPDHLETSHSPTPPPLSLPPLPPLPTSTEAAVATATTEEATAPDTTTTQIEKNETSETTGVAGLRRLMAVLCGIFVMFGSPILLSGWLMASWWDATALGLSMDLLFCPLFIFCYGTWKRHEYAPNETWYTAARHNCYRLMAPYSLLITAILTTSLLATLGPPYFSTPSIWLLIIYAGQFTAILSFVCAYFLCPCLHCHAAQEFCCKDRYLPIPSN